ncbi:arylamine N-acetyltransferase family protein [Streptomyces sp. O3]
MDSSALPTAVDHSPQWGSVRLDLDAYLARVGYDGPREPTAQTLQRLHRAHMTAFCFENIDIALGRRVAIDIDSIQHKLLRTGRGGYCYETNLLFAAALDRLGFPVTRLLSRIREGSTRHRFRSHTSTLVRAGGTVWLADPGYGYAGLIEPIPLTLGPPLTVGGWTWRLTVADDHWILQELRGDDWFDLYGFRPEPQYEVDYQAAHYVSSTRPSSPFVGHLVAQRGQEKIRHRLRDTQLTTDHADGRTERRTLCGVEVVHTLRDTFGLTLTDEDERLLLRFVRDLPDETRPTTPDTRT